MDEKKLTVRVPGEIYELLEKSAAEDLRSANAQLVYLLREALAQRQAEEAAAEASSARAEGLTPQSVRRGRPVRNGVARSSSLNR